MLGDREDWLTGTCDGAGAGGRDCLTSQAVIDKRAASVH
jgi:hypothetical protein